MAYLCFYQLYIFDLLNQKNLNLPLIFVVVQDKLFQFPDYETIALIYVGRVLKLHLDFLVSKIYLTES